ncbi:MAG TPA: hypothetical protein VIE68_08315, partial [Gemmatimonadota bacterium]
MKRAGLLVLVLAVGCMPARYREEPPPQETEPTAEPPPTAGAAAVGGATIVGHVAPDGTLVADTLARSVPDTARVERETVVTGEIRPAAELETAPAPTAGPDTGPATPIETGTLATGWRVQLFASRA